MAPARVESTEQDPVTGTFGKKFIQMIGVGEKKIIGTQTIQGTQKGFTMRQGEDEHIERVEYDDVDAHDLPETTRRIVTPEGTIYYLTATKG